MLDKVKKNDFAINSFILFTGTAVVNVLNYFFHLVLGRISSVEMFGEIEALISFTRIISVPAMALTIVATKFSAHAKAENSKSLTRGVFNYLNKKVFVLGIPLFIFALFFTSFIANFVGTESLWSVLLIWVLMFLLFFNSVSSGFLSGFKKFKQLNRATIIGTIAKFLTGILMVFVGFGAAGAIGGFLVGGIVTYLFSILWLKPVIKSNGAAREKEKGHLLKKEILSLKSYVPAAFLGMLAFAVLGNVDMVIARHNLDQISSGQFGALTVVSKTIFFTVVVFSTVMFSMSAEENRKKRNPLGSFFQALVFTALVAFVATLLFFVAPEFILNLFFGEKYLAVAEYLGWFAIMVSLSSIAYLIFQFLLSIQKTKTRWFLFLAALEVPLILLWGKDILSIVFLASLVQFLAITLGIWLVYKLKVESKSSPMSLLEPRTK